MVVAHYQHIHLGDRNDCLMAKPRQSEEEEGRVRSLSIEIRCRTTHFVSIDSEEVERILFVTRADGADSGRAVDGLAGLTKHVWKMLLANRSVDSNEVRRWRASSERLLWRSSSMKTWMATSDSSTQDSCLKWIVEMLEAIYSETKKDNFYLIRTDVVPVG